MTVSLTVSRTFEAAPEAVFDAWLDPKRASRFLFATPDGQMIRAEIDARVGGKFCFVDRRPGMGDVEHVGEYLEIDRPRRLVFTFGVPQFSKDFTTVTVAITPKGPGCELVLTHEGVYPDMREQTAKGWGMILEGLGKAL